MRFRNYENHRISSIVCSEKFNNRTGFEEYTVCCLIFKRKRMNNGIEKKELKNKKNDL